MFKRGNTKEHDRTKKNDKTKPLSIPIHKSQQPVVRKRIKIRSDCKVEFWRKGQKNKQKGQRREPFPLCFELVQHITVLYQMIVIFTAFFTFVLGYITRSFFARSEAKKMMDQFKGLSSDIAKQNSESFLQLASVTFEKYQSAAEMSFEKKNDSFDQLLEPVQKSLEQVDKKVVELEKARIGAYSGLKQQVDSLLQSQKDLRSETANLVKALRQPLARGRWGEIQLKRVVEMAGMLEHCDFCQQTTINATDHRLRPDLIVHLPGDKRIIVDAKAPLEAYLEAIETEDETVKTQQFVAHARQIRQHITALGKKSYWDQFAESPEFVVLFLPGEPFFSAALQHDPELIEAGVEQRVILATPTTLIALLRSANYGWRQERISQNAEEVGRLGRELHKRLCDMNTHWNKVGRGLQTAVMSFNKAVGSFENRVMPQARRFKELKSVGEESEITALEQVELVTRQIDVTSDNTQEDESLR